MLISKTVICTLKYSIFAHVCGPQNGSEHLRSAAASPGFHGAAEPLSALVVWTESRREEGAQQHFWKCKYLYYLLLSKMSHYVHTKGGGGYHNVNM